METPRVRQSRHFADRTRSLSTLGRIDYGDIATIATKARATPEEWMRAVIEHAGGVPAQLFWRAIGIRLAPDSPGNVGGWRVVGAADDWIVLETSSWYTTANAIGEVSDGRFSLTLLARFDNPAARILCPPITLVHRRGIGMLLRDAERRLESMS